MLNKELTNPTLALSCPLQASFCLFHCTTLVDLLPLAENQEEEYSPPVVLSMRYYSFYTGILIRCSWPFVF